MKRIFITALFLTSFVFSAIAEELGSMYKNMTKLEQQIDDLRTQYFREKQSNDQRLVRIQQAKRKGDNQAAERELRDAYVAAERLGQLNGRVNEKQHELEAMCSGWGQLYGPAVDALLVEAEKNSNGKKRAEIGTRLQKYQSLNSRLCVQVPNVLSSEWRNLRIEAYDGPQEISQKVQLLRDISREMSIGLARLEQQYQQTTRERLTRERAQEFVDEGTLFEGGVTVRSRPTGDGGIETTGSGPLSPEYPPQRADNGETSTGMIESASPWAGTTTPAQAETEYRKQRSELVKHQEELRKKIKEFEEKERALFQP